ncbi:MAG: hypothetical protein N4A72_02925 [Bacteroidales bacterium]|jgi:hypothetical protein|nr:hypothetical protein [Bacteroidales bacterium]
MQRFFLILTVIVLVLNQSCREDSEDCHRTIEFRNRTSESIYISASFDYPDTSSFAGMPNPILDAGHSKVLPNSINRSRLRYRGCIESKFKYSIKSDTMMIYVFDAEILENNNWEDVKCNYMVIKRYDVSLQDLINNNWIITHE